jgi:hypothetical protein
MKTTTSFLPAMALLLCLTTANAQSNFGEFRWGLKGGVNFASAYNVSEGIEVDKNRVGFVGGAFCKLPLSSKVSIRPELLFHMKGATLDIPSDIVGQINDVQFAMNYLELPLSLDFDLPFFLDLHAGVQGSLLLSKKLKVDGSTIDEPSGFKNNEFGWHVGAGIDLGNIGIHVRFQQSLASYYEQFQLGTGDINVSNWGISLTASYMFVN